MAIRQLLGGRFHLLVEISGFQYFALICLDCSIVSLHSFMQIRLWSISWNIRLCFDHSERIISLLRDWYLLREHDVALWRLADATCCVVAIPDSWGAQFHRAVIVQLLSVQFVEVVIWGHSYGWRLVFDHQITALSLSCARFERQRDEFGPDFSLGSQWMKL